VYAGLFCNAEETKGHQISVSHLKTDTTDKSNRGDTKGETLNTLLLQVAKRSHN